MPRLPPEEFAACVGLDWADAKPDSCLPAAGAEKRECSLLAHPPAPIDTGANPLRQRFNGPPLAIGLERTKGPLVSALRKYDCCGLFPVKPLTLAWSRDACPPSPAQDAPPDAALQRALLRTHRATLTPLPSPSPAMRARAPLVEPRRRVVGDTGRLPNRLTRPLTNSFPPGLPWFHEQATAIFCDVLPPWPTLQAAPLARRSPVARVFRAQPGRYAKIREQRSWPIIPVKAGRTRGPSPVASA